MWNVYINGFKTYIILEKSYSEHTQEAYLRDIGRLVGFLEENHPDLGPKDIEYKHINKFVESFRGEDSSFNVASIKRLISGIRAFYKYLIIEKVVDHDPTELLDLPKLDEKLPTVLSYDEFLILLDHIDNSTYKGAWTNLAFEILYGGGLRVSELINLKISNIFYEEEVIKVVGKGDKERWVPINQTALKALKTFIENTRVEPRPGMQDFVFLNQRGGQLSRIAVYQAVKEVAQRSNIDKNIHPHTFRHSFATELISSGADIMVVRELMGHEDISSTQIYTHLDTRHLRETILLYHPLYNNQDKV